MMLNAIIFLYHWKCEFKQNLLNISDISLKTVDLNKSKAHTRKKAG